ncbi:hypothetical protein LTR86_007300 [Recurvomyces mirabilis]|nr:hypothetical protein LTR86_007300 [Recurvomyces mirabilis]
MFIASRRVVVAERWLLLSARARLIVRDASNITTPKQPEVTRDAKGHIDIADLLSKPTWSVASLLPPKDASPTTPEISSKQLHHLLRLSALPPPTGPEEEQRMLSTLSSQLHFVNEIQKVETFGVEPLQSLRDETAEGEKEAELGLDALKDALAKEEVRGSGRRGRIRRIKSPPRTDEEKWDVLGTAGKKTGRYFVVEAGPKEVHRSSQVMYAEEYQQARPYNIAPSPTKAFVPSKGKPQLQHN